ncbi:capsid assembly scaffolding protein Gp46 family protein [Streptococcus uberis]|uniref:capsid assembly scaffolding protein Gp46 family protein n=1 Tax=Streptococcus uberis TaxID=1349 RepID=UPI002FEA35BA
MSEFKAITSQEELDSIVKARVAREREKYSDYEELKTKVADFESKEATYQSTIEELKNEKTDLSSQLESVNSELNQTKLQTAKQRIATEFGLPLDLADRLQGEDEEGFKADAERLASYMAPKQPTPPVKSNEPNVDPIHAALSSMVD